MKSEEWLILFLLIVIVLVASLSPMVQENRIANHCELTGTYVIDNDTVLRCVVMKQNTGEAKPSERKEEEQSL